MKNQLHEHYAHADRVWNTRSTVVETILFVCVQAVMLVCIVLVAVQLVTTA